MKQKEIFKKQEADQWYLRNKEYLENEQSVGRDIPLRLIAEYKLTPKKVLEVGAADGFRLAALAKGYKAACTALEPSAQAIAAGKKKYPAVTFVKGTAEALPFKDGAFDLVIINFVLHWLDRIDLLCTVSELDRVLRDGGHLLIGDFYPDHPGKFAYKHVQSGVYTFTQRYPNIFLASGLYALLGIVTADQRTKAPAPDVPSDRRIGFALLRKSLEGMYEERSL